MPRIYKLSRAGLRLLYKIRHHKGHGIHSPFVFNLITKVIEEKSPYHAYEDISFALEESHLNLFLKKRNRLIFRLSNYFSPLHILELGSGNGVNTLCLTAPSNNIVCTCLETNKINYSIAQVLYEKWERKIELYTEDALPSLAEKQDCILIDLGNYKKHHLKLIEYLSELIHEKTFIIVTDIRTNKRNQALWKIIINIESRTAVLDLFNMGIIFFDKKLYRWKYQISF